VCGGAAACLKSKTSNAQQKRSIKGTSEERKEKKRGEEIVL